MEEYYEFGCLHKAMQEKYGEDFIHEIGEDAFFEVVEDCAEVLSKKYLENSKEYYEVALNQKGEFEDKVRDKWRGVFEKFEGYIQLCFEVVAYYNKANKTAAQEEGSFQFLALKQLHAKSILVAREVQTLLENGYADGAFARWRTLHEIGVACVVISRSPESAIRFIYSEKVKNYNGAVEYNKYHERLNHDPIPERDIEELRLLRDDAIKVLGKDYESKRSAYEWARPFFNERGWSKKTRISFAKLEEIAGLEHYRPYYDWACEKTMHLQRKILQTLVWVNILRQIHTW